jgi:hypothetical protein
MWGSPRVKVSLNRANPATRSTTFWRRSRRFNHSIISSSTQCTVEARCAGLTSALVHIPEASRTSREVRNVPNSGSRVCVVWVGHGHLLLVKRKPNPKRRAAVISIFFPYQPVVRLDNGARDGQSHAHAFRLAGKKRFEDRF